MIKKTKEYNECLNWIKNRINNLGPQQLADIMWHATDTNIDCSYISYIVNYDNHLIMDGDGFICINNNKKNTNELKTYSYGVLKPQ